MFNDSNITEEVIKIVVLTNNNSNSNTNQSDLISIITIISPFI
jgi:hypothetical protein